MSHKAKLFLNGRSQAVRIPQKFRFVGCKEVFIRKDSKTGDVILSRKPGSWESYFELVTPWKFRKILCPNGTMELHRKGIFFDEAVYAGHEHRKLYYQGKSAYCEATLAQRANGKRLYFINHGGRVLFGVAKKPEARQLPIAVQELLIRVDRLSWIQLQQAPTPACVPCVRHRESRLGQWICSSLPMPLLLMLFWCPMTRLF